MRQVFSFCLLLVFFTVGCDRSISIPREDIAEDAKEANSQSSVDAQLRRLMSEKKWGEVKTLIRKVMISRPDDETLLRQLAIAEGSSGNQVVAAELMAQYVLACDPPTEVSVNQALRAFVEVGRLMEAINFLEQIVQSYPQLGSLRRTLVGFLGEAQRTDAIGKHLAELIREHQYDAPLLMSTTDMSTRRFAEQTIQLCRDRNPSDLRLRFPEARNEFSRGNYSQAAKVLEEIVLAHPDDVASHGLLLRTLSLQQDWGALHENFRSIASDPARMDSLRGNADYWVAIANQLEAGGKIGESVAAYLVAVHARPNDAAAWLKLGEIAGRMEENDKVAKSDLDVAVIVDDSHRRVSMLLELRKHFFRFAASDRKDASEAIEIAQQLAGLGRHLEASAWTFIANDLLEAGNRTQGLRLRDVVGQLRASGEADRWVSAARWPTLKTTKDSIADRELSQWLDVVPVGGLRQTFSAPYNAGWQKEIQLKAVAKASGLDFYGAVGNRVEGPHVPLSQTLGCGAGALDFDLDGLVDAVFAAAGGSINKSDSEGNALFRNIGATENQDMRFQRVRDSAWLADRTFTQGIVVGDFNQDGFPDLLACSIGDNQLYQNNGDGSFQNVTVDSKLAGDPLWSTSGLMMDLDQDGVCDLMTLSYAASDQAIDQPCFRAGTSEEESCHPLQFLPSPDQFWKGLPDGTFVNRSQQWGKNISPALGLGVIGGRLSGKETQVYVANDMSANHLLSVGSDSEGQFEWIDRAAASGVAVDARGLTQASMGIATGDYNQDGMLDFYVTGFAREYNILYGQVAPGIWSDQSVAYGLVPPTLNFVGFGAQSVDLDNDMSDELFVSNGHIGDFGEGLPPYAQRPQLFQLRYVNQSKVRRFVDVFEEESSEYFDDSHVGRAAVVADFNADQKLDLLVTHATRPVELLRNETESEHGALTLTVVGVSQARDPIGAVIEIRPVDREGVVDEQVTKYCWHLGGDGYLASNPSSHVVGTGPFEAAQLVVEWPDGTREEFGTVPCRKSYVLIEGAGEGFSW